MDRELIARIPIFSSLDPAHLDWMATIAHRQRFHKDQIIYYQGDPGTAMYVVATGSVKMVLLSEASGAEVLVAVVKAGEHFGELAILDGGSRSVTAIAAQATEVLAIHREELLAFLSERGDAAVQVARSLSLRLRRVTELLADLAFLSLLTRVAKCVCHLAVEAPGRPDGSATITVTQAALAEMVGATREAVNKQLARLRALGIIATRRGQVQVLSLEKLRAVSVLDRFHA